MTEFNDHTIPPSLRQKLITKFLADSTSSSFTHPSIVNHPSKSEYVTLEMYEVSGDEIDRTRINNLEDIIPASLENEIKILIEGKTSVGKSTTLSALSELWAKGIFSRFEHLFKIKLEVLLNSDWKSDYPNEIRQYPLACLVHFSLEQTIKREGEDEHTISLEEIIEIFKAEDQMSTLLLVDGYDKIEPLIGKKYIRTILDQILTEFPNYIVTARPDTMVPLIKNSFNRFIEFEGLDIHGIISFIKFYFNSQSKFLIKIVTDFSQNEHQPVKDIKALLSYLKRSRDISSLEAYSRLKKIFEQDQSEGSLQIITNKIKEYLVSTIDAIIRLAESNTDIQKFLSNPGMATLFFIKMANSINLEPTSSITLNKLYEGILDQIAEKFSDTDMEHSVDTLKEFLALKDLAYIELQTGSLSSSDVIRIAGIYRTDVDTLISLGLIRNANHNNNLQSGISPIRMNSFREIRDRLETRENKHYKFNDKSILDYFAAHALVDRLKLEKGSAIAREAAELIALHRYDTNYLTLIKFVAGILRNIEVSDSIAINRFIEAIRTKIHETAETGISNAVILWMNVLSQMMIDGKPDPRIPEISEMVQFIDKIIQQDFLQYKQAIISTGYISAEIIKFLESVIRQSSYIAKDEEKDFAADHSHDTLKKELSQDSISEEEKTAEISSIPARELLVDAAIRKSVGIRIIDTKELTSISLFKAVIEVYSTLISSLDNHAMFTLLLPNLSSHQDSLVIKSTIIAISKIIKNKKLGSEEINTFEESLLQLDDPILNEAIEYARVAISTLSDTGSTIKLIRLGSFDSFSTETAISRSKSPQKTFKTTIEQKQFDVEPKDLSEYISSLLESDENTLEKIRFLIDNLNTYSVWKEALWEEQINNLFSILNYCRFSESVDQRLLKSLIRVTHKAIQTKIREANDNSHNLWFIDNFDQIKLAASELLSSIVQSFIYQALSDYQMTPEECSLICFLINQGIESSITVKPAKIIEGIKQYTISFNGRDYILVGEENTVHIERIVKTAIDFRVTIDAPSFTNTGSGIRIAASDIDCQSMIDSKNLLSSSKTLLSIVYETRHIYNNVALEIVNAFLILETRDPYFGNYRVTKISVDASGNTVSNTYERYPDERDTAFKTLLFGAMQYIDNKKTRIATYTTEISDSQDILSNTAKSSTVRDTHSVPRKSINFSIGEKPSSNKKVSLEEKIRIIYDLISQVQIDLTEEPLEDINSGKFVIHGREIIDAIDVSHAETFRIELDAGRAAFDRFKQEIDLEVLKRVLSAEELSEHARIEMAEINESHYLRKKYETIVLLSNAAFVAISAISTGRVADQSRGALGTIGSIFKEVGNDLPLFGRAVKIVGSIFTAIDRVTGEERIENFRRFALSSMEMAEISDKLARKLVRESTDKIQKNLLEQIEIILDAGVEAVNSGPAYLLVKACKTFKDKVEVDRKKTRLSAEEKASEEEQKRGEEEGEIIAQIILESIFSGKYIVPLEKGFYKATKTAVKKAYNRGETLSTIIAKEVIHQLNTEETFGTTVGSRFGASSQEITSHNNDRNIARQPEKCTPHHCTIMLLNEVRYNNPEIQRIYEQGYKIFPEVHKPVLHLKMVNYFEGSKIAEELLKKAELLYGKEAAENLKKLGQEHDLAEQILEQAIKEGVEKVLDILFGLTDTKAIENYSRIIESETSTGYYQYLYNALGYSNLKKAALEAIKSIGYLQERIEQMLDSGASGNKVTILLTILESLVAYTESGQFSLPIRPPYHNPFDDGDHGPGGNGGSGIFFESRRENNTAQDIDFTGETILFALQSNYTDNSM